MLSLPALRRACAALAGNRHVSTQSYAKPNRVVTSAWLEHAPFAFWLVDALRPHTIVELGTHNGYSYFAFCQAVAALKLETQCFAIDTWEGDEHAGFYDDKVFDAVRNYNCAKYAGFSRLIRSTFDDALGEFQDGSIDLLHVDGRHFYDDVRHDFESWVPKLSDRAVVLFHDTTEFENGFGVYKLWREVASRWPSFEFLHGHGLGVLGFGSNIPAQVSDFLSSSSDPGATQAVRRTYEHLGHSISRRQR